jgi:hypothetical protein
MQYPAKESPTQAEFVLDWMATAATTRLLILSVVAENRPGAVAFPFFLAFAKGFFSPALC